MGLADQTKGDALLGPHREHALAAGDARRQRRVPDLFELHVEGVVAAEQDRLGVRDRKPGA